MRKENLSVLRAFVFALFFSTNGINSMIEAFNASYHNIEMRGIFAQRWVAFVLVLVLALMLVVAITFITVGSALLQYMRTEGFLQDKFIYFLIDSIRWIVLIALTYFGISLIYYWAPAKKRPFKLSRTFEVELAGVFLSMWMSC